MYNGIQNMSDELFFFPIQQLCLLEPVTWILDPKCLHKKAASLLINWTCAVSGQWADLQDVATAMPLFCLCLQNNPVPTERAKAQAVPRPLWVLGAQGGAAAWLKRLSVLTLCPVQLECLHPRKGVYSDWSRPHCFSCLQAICVG